MKEPQVKMVTFYSQGESIDGVKSLDISKSEHIMKKFMTNHVDSYKGYTYNEVKEMNEVIVKNFDINNTSNQGSGYTGFFRWKPFVIYTQLQSAEYGDIVYYRDCNVIKYPGYLIGHLQTKENIAYVLEKNQCDIYVPIETEYYKWVHFIKREVFDYFTP